jgi:filamentous hemagglutinin
MPPDTYMRAKVSGYSRGQGIAMNMEMPVPGTGGRHRLTESYSTPPDLTLTPRRSLARAIWDARSVYQVQGLYTPEMRESLLQVIQQNKAAWPNVFEKR